MSASATQGGHNNCSLLCDKRHSAWVERVRYGSTDGLWVGLWI